MELTGWHLLRGRLFSNCSFHKFVIICTTCSFHNNNTNQRKSYPTPCSRILSDIHLSSLRYSRLDARHAKSMTKAYGVEFSNNDNAYNTTTPTFTPLSWTPILISSTMYLRTTTIFNILLQSVHIGVCYLDCQTHVTQTALRMAENWCEHKQTSLLCFTRTQLRRLKNKPAPVSTQDVVTDNQTSLTKPT